jgi:hypothetical protein
MISFRVKPNPERTHYYRVEVYPTAAALQREPCPITGARGGLKGVVGLCLSYKKRSGSRLLPEVGTIRLCRSHLDISTISHEATHAALRYIERLGLCLPEDYATREWSCDEEEALCDAQAEVFERIVDGVVERGLVLV